MPTTNSTKQSIVFYSKTLAYVIFTEDKFKVNGFSFVPETILAFMQQSGWSIFWFDAEQFLNFSKLIMFQCKNSQQLNWGLHSIS